MAAAGVWVRCAEIRWCPCQARHWLPGCQAEEEEQRGGGQAPRWVACTLHLGRQPHARAPGRRQAGGCPGLPASRWDGVGAPATSLTLVPVPWSAAWRGFCLPGWWRTASLSEAGGWEGGARKPVLGAGPGWRGGPEAPGPGVWGSVCPSSRERRQGLPAAPVWAGRLTHAALPRPTASTLGLTRGTEGPQH